MQWTADDATLNALMGEGWRNLVESGLELRRMLHDGAPDDVHAFTLRDGRVAWCSVSTRGVAICLGVEERPGILGAGEATSLPRAEFFGLVPYGIRRGWRDARSADVRKAAKGGKPAEPIELGAWVVIVRKRDVTADDPMAGLAHVAKVTGVDPLRVALKPEGAPIQVDPELWDVRGYSKWADVAPSLWDGRNVFTYGFACKVAGQHAWRASRAARKSATR